MSEFVCQRKCFVEGTLYGEGDKYRGQEPPRDAMKYFTAAADYRREVTVPRPPEVPPLPVVETHFDKKTGTWHKENIKKKALKAAAAKAKAQPEISDEERRKKIEQISREVKAK